MLRASGAMEAAASFLSPVFSFLGIPPETAALVLVRPISGSAALAVGADLMAQYGPDSPIGRTAAIMLGSTETTFYKQLRKQKRSLHEATPRKGRREPNRTAKRNRKNTCVVKGWYLNDKVTVFGKTGWISGFSGKSSVYIRDCENEYITVPGKNYKLVPISQIKMITHCNNWAVYTKIA